MSIDDDIDDDINAWRREVANVKPLKHKVPAELPKSETEVATKDAPIAQSTPSVRTAPPPRSPSPKNIPPVAIGNIAGVDTATLRKLKRGQMPIHATLDFHGMKQAEALETLEYFVQRHAGGKRKLLLIITGKGGIENPGILKISLPQWLNLPTIRPSILYVDYANREHGGSGAFYVLLRKNPL